MNRQDRQDLVRVLEHVRDHYVADETGQRMISNVLPWVLHDSRDKAYLLEDVAYARKHGLTTTDIANKYGVNCYTVSRWLQRHREVTGEDLRDPRGRPRKT